MPESCFLSAFSNNSASCLCHPCRRLVESGQNNRFVLQHRFSFQITKHQNTQESPKQKSAQQRSKTNQHHNTPEGNEPKQNANHTSARDLQLQNTGGAHCRHRAEGSTAHRSRGSAAALLTGGSSALRSAHTAAGSGQITAGSGQGSLM